MSKLIELFNEVGKGKTIGRILFNWKIQEACKDIHDTVLDLGAGTQASYLRYLPKDAQIISTDLQANSVDVLSVDLNKPLPFRDESYKTIFLFNSIYILEDRVATLKEIRRVLTDGGTLYFSSPFISPEIPEPHDYCHLSYEGLQKELCLGGFSNITIERIGGRATAAANLLYPLFLFNMVRFLAFSFCLFLDRRLKKRDLQHPAPIMYFGIAKK